MRCHRTLAGLGLALAASLTVNACADGQDPGLDQQVDIDGQDQRPTSNTLGDCPPGGPDATTPTAGCLDEDGSVVRR